MGKEIIRGLSKASFFCYTPFYNALIIRVKMRLLHRAETNKNISPVIFKRSISQTATPYIYV